MATNKRVFIAFAIEDEKYRNFSSGPREKPENAI